MAQPAPINVEDVPMEAEDAPKLRNFDGNGSNHYDVVLVVEGERFHVMKGHLAHHSEPFNTMFFSDFVEKNRKEVELSDVDAHSFQVFLELINGELCLTDYNIEGVLIVSQQFLAETALKRCQDFLVKESKLPTMHLFDISVLYGFDKLTEKVVSKATTSEMVEVTKIMNQFDCKTREILLKKSLLSFMETEQEELAKAKEQAKVETELQARYRAEAGHRRLLEETRRLDAARVEARAQLEAEASVRRLAEARQKINETQASLNENSEFLAQFNVNRQGEQNVQDEATQARILAFQGADLRRASDQAVPSPNLGIPNEGPTLGQLLAEYARLAAQPRFGQPLWGLQPAPAGQGVLYENYLQAIGMPVLAQMPAVPPPRRQMD